MAARTRSYRWEWTLEAPPQALWPLVSDTNRFNAETGAPRVEPLGVEASGARRLRLRALGREVEFEEEPFEWVRPERFGVVRRYASGPIAELRARLALAPRGGGSLLSYEVDAAPRGVLGRVTVPVALGRVARRRMEEAFRRLDAEARAASSGLAPPTGGEALAPGGRERLAAGGERLVAQGEPEALVGLLLAEVAGRDRVSAARLRPYALADAWGESRRAVLELCLRAVPAGILEARWELLCPLCRGAQDAAPTLAELERHAHCDACLVDVDADLERSVELTLRPSPAVREVEDASFCVGGPGVTPHVVAQQRLSAGEERILRIPLEPGGYRLRTLGVDGSRPLRVEPADPQPVEVRLVNGQPARRVVLLERTAWSDAAATAADVTALQAFRDLFASEALRPGEELAVGSLTVVFTDLRGSTRLYRRLGDAPAYGSVVAHFDVLREHVAREGGAVVKTIGDAVLAVFRRPVSALRAFLDAQARLAEQGRGRPPLELKVGINVGPCLAVSMNDRLDYFGSTVNAAARMVALSDGTDVVASGDVVADPEVVLELGRGGVTAEPLDAELAGFDGERFALWRLRRG